MLFLSPLDAVSSQGEVEREQISRASYKGVRDDERRPTGHGVDPYLPPIPIESMGQR